ncbi:MAG: nucleotidyltransferase domain-containing protein [Candidatus Margulisiibacteriota bacterium]|nr:nucleotidyltransferase domain-containing protein [Candidatus Margulisiibacteriota bacterium]
MRDIRQFKQKLNFVIKNAAKRTSPAKIILFGSYAYGKPNKDSDVDLLFIKDTRLKGVKRHSHFCSKIDHIFPVDIIVKTPAEIKKRLDMGDPFYREIIQKGVVLYESPK